jgi:hypothetical protein
VQLLVGGRSLHAEEIEAHLAFTVPTILAHEVVAIDLVSG